MSDCRNGCGRVTYYTSTGECMACYARRRHRENPVVAEANRERVRRYRRNKKARGAS